MSGSLYRILYKSNTRVLVSTFFTFVACLEADSTLLLTHSGLVSKFPTDVAFNAGTLCAPVPSLLPHLHAGLGK